MKRLFTGIFLTLFLLTATALGAPQTAEEFQKTSGLPNNLPSGWSFSKESTQGYQIYVPIVLVLP